MRPRSCDMCPPKCGGLGWNRSNMIWHGKLKCEPNRTASTQNRAGPPRKRSSGKECNTFLGVSHEARRQKVVVMKNVRVTTLQLPWIGAGWASRPGCWAHGCPGASVGPDTQYTLWTSVEPKPDKKGKPDISMPFPKGEPEEPPVSLNNLNMKISILQVYSDEPNSYTNLSQNSVLSQIPEMGGALYFRTHWSREAEVVDLSERINPLTRALTGRGATVSFPNQSVRWHYLDISFSSSHLFPFVFSLMYILYSEYSHC